MTEALATVLTIVVLALLVLGREVIRLRDRVSWLEAKVNGKPDRGKV